MTISNRVRNQLAASSNAEGIFKITRRDDSQSPNRPNGNGNGNTNASNANGTNATTTTTTTGHKRDRTGVWSAEEHERFIEALECYPNGPWRRIAEYIGTKTPRQVMSHAQKYRQKLERRKQRDLALRQIRSIKPHSFQELWNDPNEKVQFVPHRSDPNTTLDEYELAHFRYIEEYLAEIEPLDFITASDEDELLKHQQAAANQMAL